MCLSYLFVLFCWYYTEPSCFPELSPLVVDKAKTHFRMFLLCCTKYCILKSVKAEQVRWPFVAEFVSLRLADCFYLTQVFQGLSFNSKAKYFSLFKQMNHVKDRFGDSVPEEVLLLCLGITSGVGRLVFGRVADYIPGAKKIYLQVCLYCFYIPFELWVLKDLVLGTINK